MLKQAKRLQAQMAKIQEELGKTTVESSSGGGAVKIVINGHQKVKSIEILPEAVDVEDIEMLQDLILTAVNEAIEKSQDEANKHLSQLTGGLNLPGLT